jgi:hypothetical protein
MAAQSDGIRILRFSTDELPERARLPMMREVHGRLTAKVDIEPAPGVPLHYRVIAGTLPGLTVSMFSESALTIRRTRELLADGNDDVVFAVPPTAANMLSHRGRELSPIGDAVLLSTADVLRIDVASGSQGPMVTLSRRRLAPLVPGLEDAFMRPVPRDTEALQLLTRYIRIFDDLQSLATPNCVASWSIMSTISSRLRSARRAMLLRLQKTAASGPHACMRSKRKSSTA